MSEWHLDKKVPITMVIAFFIQTVTLVWVGSTWKENTEGRLLRLEQTDNGRTTHESRIIILEQSMNYIRSDLTEIKNLLRGKADRQ